MPYTVLRLTFPAGHVHFLGASSPRMSSLIDSIEVGMCPQAAGRLRGLKKAAVVGGGGAPRTPPKGGWKPPPLAAGLEDDEVILMGYYQQHEPGSAPMMTATVIPITMTMRPHG